MNSSMNARIAGAILRPSKIGFPDNGRGIHLRLAIESATAHAAPATTSALPIA